MADGSIKLRAAHLLQTFRTYYAHLLCRASERQHGQALNWSWPPPLLQAASVIVTIMITIITTNIITIIIIIIVKQVIIIIIVLILVIVIAMIIILVIMIIIIIVIVIYEDRKGTVRRRGSARAGAGAAQRAMPGPIVRLRPRTPELLSCYGSHGSARRLRDMHRRRSACTYLHALCCIAQRTWNDTRLPKMSMECSGEQQMCDWSQHIISWGSCGCGGKESLGLGGVANRRTADLRTKIMDFKGFD